MSETNHINLDYRPESYWPESLTPDQLISRIQGKVRQDIARSKFKTEGFTGLTAFIAREELDENDKVMWGRIHPLFMGGEYLPSLEQIEVEIARISLKSVTGDQISIRARKTDGTIIYSVVGEYGEDMQYQQPFDESNEPLKLAELVKLIDGSAIPVTFTLEGL